MQFANAFAAVTAVARMQARQVQPTNAPECSSLYSSLSSAAPPLPTELASIYSEMQTDPCAVLKVTSFSSAIEQYESEFYEWQMQSSIATQVFIIGEKCDAYLSSSLSDAESKIKTCGLNPSSSRSGSASATTTTGTATTTTTGVTSSGASQTGTAGTGSAAATTTTSTTGSGARSGVSMVLAAGVAVVGGLLLL